MLYLLLLASLLNLAALGTLGEPCGETVQIHTLTQTLPQHTPVSDNVTTQQSHLTWTYMVIHINIFTMAAPREDPQTTALGKDKKKYQDVLDAFDSYFKPMQTIMHSWYQLGNIYSSQCKDQTEFMTRLKELSKETGFKEPDELTKFLFVIYNTDSKVKEYLIDKGDLTKTCTEFLEMARSVESMVKTETLSRELLGHVGKVPVSSIDRSRGRV